MSGPKISAAKKTVFGFAAAVIVAAVCLLVLELVLRIVSPPNLFTPLLPLRPHLKLELHPRLNGVSPVARHTTNRWGLRGEEPPLARWDEHLTIVTIGGSTTLCFYLDDAKTWPHLIQTRLRSRHPAVWVGNGGLDGQSTRAHLIFADEVLSRIRPDAAIFLTGINDLGFSISEPVRVLGNPYDRKDIWNRKVKFFLFQSRLVQTLYVWKLILWDRVEVVRDNPHHNYEPKALNSPQGPIPADARPLLPGLPEYRRNLTNLIDSCRRSGVRPIFLTQPLRFEVTPYWHAREGGAYWMRNIRGKISAAMLRHFLNAYNAELLDVCRREGVDCLDLASELGTDPEYFYDTMHFTEKGAERVAELVSDFMLRVWPDAVPAAPGGTK